LASKFLNPDFFGRSDKGSDFWRNETLCEDRRAKRSPPHHQNIRANDIGRGWERQSRSARVIASPKAF
jgi:hypothetical protein